MKLYFSIALCLYLPTSISLCLMLVNLWPKLAGVPWLMSYCDMIGVKCHMCHDCLLCVIFLGVPWLIAWYRQTTTHMYTRHTSTHTPHTHTHTHTHSLAFALYMYTRHTHTHTHTLVCRGKFTMSYRTHFYSLLRLYSFVHPSWPISYVYIYM